jgi:hypothetical protein
MEELVGDSEVSIQTDAATTTNLGRPIWTWDRDLPMLTHLLLNAEFAYGFQFKILQGVPRLCCLTVLIRSTSSLHNRTISIENLLHNTGESKRVNCIQDDDDDNNNNALNLRSEYIQRPLLERLVSARFVEFGLTNIRKAKVK